jgi:subtilisin family serine protease
VTRTVRRAFGGVAKAVAAVAAATMIALAGATPAHADTVRDLEYWLADYGFTTAWNTSRGKGVTVAVIDTGVNGNVAELRGVVVAGTDVSGLGTSNGQTPVGEDPNHGTMVASRRFSPGAAAAKAPASSASRPRPSSSPHRSHSGRRPARCCRTTSRSPRR